MAVSVRPLLAIGLASAGIGVTLAVAAAPQAGAAPPTPATSGATSSSHQLVRNSAKASPGGGYSAGSSKANASQSQPSKRSTARHALTTAISTNSSSGQDSAPTSNKRVLSSDAATPVAVKHHWGTHNGHHGLF
jgi:hypothetical protein